MDGCHGGLELNGVVADPHCATAEHVRRPNENGILDLLDRRERLLDIRDGGPRRAANAEIAGEGAEALAILGEVDCLVRSPEDLIARVFDVACQAQRSLASFKSQFSAPARAQQTSAYGSSTKISLEAQATSEACTSRCTPYTAAPK